MEEPLDAGRIAFQSVRGEELGDALGVPLRRVQPADRQREGVAALVEEEMPPIIGV